MNIRKLLPIQALTAIYLPALAVFLTCLNPGSAIAGSATGQPANWVGDNDGDGIWGDSSAWNPMEVPNNSGGNTYDVTIAGNPNLNFLIGPAVDIDVTIDNLTLVDFGLVNGAILGGPQGVGYSLTVLGTTALTVNTPDQGTGVIQAANATFTLGTLTNYDSSSKTLISGGIHAFSGISSQPAVMRWHGADIVTNNGFISLNGVNADLRNQDNGANALANFATNNGAFLMDNGHVISTIGNFTNEGFIGLFHEDPNAPTTLFQVNGNLTNSFLIRLSEGSQLKVTGNLTIPADAFNTNEIDLGEIGSDNSYRLVAARLDMAAGTKLGGTGTLFCDIVSQGGFAPGHSAGKISIEGGLTLQSPSVLTMEIGGTSPGTQFDQIVQQGGTGTVLDGTLELSFIDGFESTIQNGNTFSILTSDQPLTGSFDNVASGARLITTDGLGSFRVTYSGQNTVTLSNFLPAPQPSIAFSRKMHGAFIGDLALPLTGTPGVEPRSGGTSGVYQIIVSFPNNIMVSDATLTGTGVVDSFSVNSGTVTVNLSGVADQQTISVTLIGVDDGTNSGSVSVSMSVLLGDTTRNGLVNGTDVSQTKLQSGHVIGSGNFVSDVNANGAINGTDVSVVKTHSGNGLPAEQAANSATPAAGKSRVPRASTMRQ